MEIVTWALSGEVAHQDSTGTSDVIYPGLAQRMSAGRGITHSEMNASWTVDTHFVQMWVQPDVKGIDPSYEQRDLGDALARGGLVPVVSGRGHEGSVLLHQKGAVLWVGRLQPGERVAVPEAPFVHVFMAIGEGTLGTDELRTGDAARLTGATDLSLTAGADGAEVLIWETT
jgi:redox-sensitive bicupin YhaK (pirin superfamily)